jgi:hypothetical protein
VVPGGALRALLGAASPPCSAVQCRLEHRSTLAA